MKLLALLQSTAVVVSGSILVSSAIAQAQTLNPSPIAESSHHTLNQSIGTLLSQSSGFNVYQQQVADQLDAAITEFGYSGYEQINEHIDPDGLYEGESHFFELDMAPGYEHAIMAVCDSDCTDIDLILYEDGVEVDFDREPGTVPIIIGVPDRAYYEVEVFMYGCSVEPCYYGVGLFREP